MERYEIERKKQDATAVSLLEKKLEEAEKRRIKLDLRLGKVKASSKSYTTLRNMREKIEQEITDAQEELETARAHDTSRFDEED